METKLQEYIDNLGGKHGAIEYFREHHPELRKYLLWQHVFGIREEVSAQAMAALERECRALGTDQVIVRSSEKSDWPGMVGIMPTKIAPLHGDPMKKEVYPYEEAENQNERNYLESQFWERPDIQSTLAQTIQRVRERCFHPEVLSYST